jgi:hypothetical protein
MAGREGEEEEEVEVEVDGGQYEDGRSIASLLVQRVTFVQAILCRQIQVSPDIQISRWISRSVQISRPISRYPANINNQYIYSLVFF